MKSTSISTSFSKVFKALVQALCIQEYYIIKNGKRYTDLNPLSHYSNLAGRKSRYLSSFSLLNKEIGNFCPINEGARYTMPERLVDGNHMTRNNRRDAP